ncbi:hypothetical protein AWB82_05606 [Caballeronia glebae]|uniref:Uncharacterized protein n=1 Tax=Caballeronia glebae TaxID=1777143 RepID=A0A158CMZ2_9BURK|nr:hypothetical protein AWB82_05606 [Caballeronia glebae]
MAASDCYPKVEVIDGKSKHEGARPSAVKSGC